MVWNSPAYAHDAILTLSYYMIMHVSHNEKRNNMKNNIDKKKIHTVETGQVVIVI